jgi:probable F420-dependent oxidoreductase
VRFGLNLSTAVAPGSDPGADAQEAERLGYDFVCVSDHLHGSTPTFETWTVLTWMAARTSRVQIVPNVLGLPYRHPAVLAKMAETLHRLSDGRLALGLGAGGMDDEFAAFGLPVRAPGDKVAALADAIEILRGVWSSSPFTHAGRQYAVDGAVVEPKPETTIPVWIGGNGPRVLALTGRLADGWIPSVPFAPPEVIPERRDIIVRAAEEAGRDPSALTFVYNVGIHVGDEASSPHIVSGAPEQVAERLASFAALGFHAVNAWPAGNEDEQRNRIATEVLPLLR